MEKEDFLTCRNVPSTALKLVIRHFMFDYLSRKILEACPKQVNSSEKTIVIDTMDLVREDLKARFPTETVQRIVFLAAEDLIDKGKFPRRVAARLTNS